MGNINIPEESIDVWFDKKHQEVMEAMGTNN